METQEETKQKIEEGNQEKPWWESVHPIVLIGAGILIIFIIRSMMMESESSNFYFLLIIVVIVVIYLLTKNTPKPKKPISPREAELYVMRDVERKQAWGQFNLMSKFTVGPVIDLAHKDTRGIYYNVAVTEENPFMGRKSWIAKVMADGLERGFVTFVLAINPMTGREVVQERTITQVPDFLKKANKYPLLERMWGLK